MANTEGFKLMLRWESWYRTCRLAKYAGKGMVGCRAQSEITMSLSYWVTMVGGLQKCEAWSKGDGLAAKLLAAKLNTSVQDHMVGGEN